MENAAVLRDDASGRWLRFQNPVAVVSAARLDDVLPRLREIEAAVERRGLHAAGWISYEAAPAFDPALAVRAPGPLPLLWFGLYEKPQPFELPAAADVLPGGWQPDLPPEAYADAFAEIKRRIRAGDTSTRSLDIQAHVLEIITRAYAAGEDYFPEGMPPVEWYRPVGRGLEIKIGEKLAHLRDLDRQALAKNSKEPRNTED